MYPALDLQSLESASPLHLPNTIWSRHESNREHITNNLVKEFDQPGQINVINFMILFLSITSYTTSNSDHISLIKIRSK